MHLTRSLGKKCSACSYWQVVCWGHGAGAVSGAWLNSVSAGHQGLFLYNRQQAEAVGLGPGLCHQVELCLCVWLSPCRICALQLQVDCVAFPPAQRSELQSDPSGLSLTCVIPLALGTENLQDSGQWEHTQAMVSFPSKHQDRILSLVIKIGSLLQGWTMSSFITLKKKGQWEE